MATSGKSRRRRKTNWRTVDLAAYDPSVCCQIGQEGEEEYVPPPRPRSKASKAAAAAAAAAYEETVTTRSEWKYMGKHVRKMLIPGSISAFASCMWVTFELILGEPIAAFSKIVELSLPYWDALPVDEADAWAERAFAEQRRAHWIYVRSGRARGGSGCEKSGNGYNGSERPLVRARHKKQEWDDEYDNEELSDTDELPSRPTRKLNIDGDETEVVPVSPAVPSVPKDFEGAEEPIPLLAMSPHPSHLIRPLISSPLSFSAAPSSVPKSVSFRTESMQQLQQMQQSEEQLREASREHWKERDGIRSVPPPPATYRPIVVSAVEKPPSNSSDYFSMQHPHQTRPRSGRGRGGYAHSSRGGFDMYSGGAPVAAAAFGAAHPPPLAAWMTSRVAAAPHAPRSMPLAPPIGFR